MRILWTFLLFSAALFAEPEFLPLQEGNSWTYRQRGGADTFTIEVGATSTIAGNVYHRLTGYVTEPLWVRFGDFGALYYRDEKLDLDVLLTSFEPFTRGWFIAPFRICEQEGQVQDVRGENSGPAGTFRSTLVIRYRTIVCADVGIVGEQYAANIGLVERTVQTIAGPRPYDLVEAHIGAPAPGARFSVSTQPVAGSSAVLATLELKVSGPAPVKLRFTSSQEFDLVLRNADGEVVWRWSADKLFLQVLKEEETSGRAWTAEVPVDFKAGPYSLDAFIVSGPEGRQFAASTPIQIQ